MPNLDRQQLEDTVNCLAETVRMQQRKIEWLTGELLKANATANEMKDQRQTLAQMVHNFWTYSLN